MVATSMTTYKRTKLHEEENKKENQKKRNKKKKQGAINKHEPKSPTLIIILSG